MNAISIPLDDAELDELEMLLASPSLPDTTLNLEAIDGLFCALIVAPGGATLGDAMPLVLGGDGNAGEPTQSELERLLVLLERHWNDLALRLNLAPSQRYEDAVYQAILYPPPDEAPQARGTMQDAQDNPDAEWWGRDWADGFSMGVESREDAWAPLLDDVEASAVLWPVWVLQHGYDPQQPSTPVKLDELAAELADIAYALRDWWCVASGRPVAPEPVRRDAEPGRNDPCPCGSGKKFKKCCGAEAR